MNIILSHIINATSLLRVSMCGFHASTAKPILVNFGIEIDVILGTVIG